MSNIGVLSKMFPNESISDIIAVMSRLQKLMPADKKEDIKYFEEILKYAEGLVHGDDIHQFATYSYLTEYAKTALTTIIPAVHGQTLETYRMKKMELEDEISKLTTLKSQIEGELQRSRQKLQELENRILSLTQQLNKLSQDLNEKLKNGITDVQRQIEETREEQMNCIAELEQQKQQLEGAISNLKQQIDAYNKKIMGIKSDTTVIWKPITPNHPIYNTTNATFSEYFHSLQKEYSEKTGETMENTKKIFQQHCPGISRVNSILNINVNQGFTIKRLINAGYYSSEIDATMSLIQLPSYTLEQLPSTNNCLNPENVPTDINGMLRELYFQKIVLEAVAKQKIAEAELNMVIQILKSVLPPNCDLKSILNSHNGFRLQTLQKVLELKPEDTTTFNF